MDINDPIYDANQAVDKRIAEKEAQLAELKSRSLQLNNLVAEEDAFVQRLRAFVQEAEEERIRLQSEFRRLVSAG